VQVLGEVDVWAGVDAEPLGGACGNRVPGAVRVGALSPGEHYRPSQALRLVQGKVLARLALAHLDGTLQHQDGARYIKEVYPGRYRPGHQRVGCLKIRHIKVKVAPLAQQPVDLRKDHTRESRHQARKEIRQ